MWDDWEDYYKTYGNYVTVPSRSLFKSSPNKSLQLMIEQIVSDLSEIYDYVTFMNQFDAEPLDFNVGSSTYVILVPAVSKSIRVAKSVDGKYIFTDTDFSKDPHIVDDEKDISYEIIKYLTYGL